MSDIQELYDDFITTYEEQYSLVQNSTVLLQSSSQPAQLFSLQMYNTVIEHCFMKIFLAWESFLEKSFILYLQDKPDLKGWHYVKFGSPKDAAHAYDMIKGTKHYPDWTNIDDVNKLAEIYFDKSGPFAVLNNAPPEMFAIKKIRNRISHISQNSITQFKSLLANNVFDTSLNPGEYLTLLKSGKQSYFSFYTELLKEYVDAICNK